MKLNCNITINFTHIVCGYLKTLSFSTLFLFEQEHFYALDFYITYNNNSNMAKPIRATPTLRGEEAKKFLRLMAKRENSPMSDADKKLYANVEKHREYFESFLD